jgi:O-antigen biosynthesis protein WbqL
MVCRVNDVLIRGADVIYSDETATFYDGFHPPYAFDLFPARELARSGQTATTIIDLAAPAVCISHWTSGTYGHFLVEMLPKIVIFQALKRVEPNAKIVISDFCGNSIVNILKLFVDEQDIFTYQYASQAVRIKALFLATNTIDRGAIHPFVEHFVALAQSYASARQERRTDQPRRLFLSKSKWRSQYSDYRKFTNEDEIQSLVTGFGFSVVHPESLSWMDQVAAFSSAEIIVGEFTSALHNAIFSPRGTTVIGLNYVNEIQDCIAAFCGHQLGYVLPNDGRARRWDPASPELYSQDFEIDPEALRAGLQMAGLQAS